MRHNENAPGVLVTRAGKRFFAIVADSRERGYRTITDEKELIPLGFSTVQRRTPEAA